MTIISSIRGHVVQQANSDGNMNMEFPKPTVKTLLSFNDMLSAPAVPASNLIGYSPGTDDYDDYLNSLEPGYAGLDSLAKIHEEFLSDVGRTMLGHLRKEAMRTTGRPVEVDFFTDLPDKPLRYLALYDRLLRSIGIANTDIRPELKNRYRSFNHELIHYVSHNLFTLEENRALMLIGMHYNKRYDIDKRYKGHTITIKGEEGAAELYADWRAASPEERKQLFDDARQNMVGPDVVDSTKHLQESYKIIGGTFPFRKPSYFKSFYRRKVGGEMIKYIEPWSETIKQALIDSVEEIFQKLEDGHYGIYETGEFPGVFFKTAPPHTEDLHLHPELAAKINDKSLFGVLWRLVTKVKRK